MKYLNDPKCDLDFGQSTIGETNNGAVRHTGVACHVAVYRVSDQCLDVCILANDS